MQNERDKELGRILTSFVLVLSVVAGIVVLIGFAAFIAILWKLLIATAESQVIP